MTNPVLFQPLGNPVILHSQLPDSGDVDPRLTRTHYFDGRLLTAADLNRDQLYLDQRLRETGEALGDGILQGLEATLEPTSSRIRVQPGVAVTAAGRALTLNRELTADLGDRALVSEVNEGAHRRFDRGLYALVLRFQEVRSGVAEVFPQDLGTERRLQTDVIADALQLGLVPLPLPLPQARLSVSIRSRLSRVLMADSEVSALLPEDSVALGVLAIRDDRPEWLDGELLRHPLRTEADPQGDLARHYESLFRDVMASRVSAATGEFAATEYFSLLPPVGSLPKGALDPVNGRQSFFPKYFNVWVAPIRRAEVALVQRESMRLPAMDLGRDEPVDVVVLAALPNEDFGHYARRLEREYDPETRRLPFLDLLRLRLYPRRPVHELDTDAATWQAIWDAIDDQDLFYVRRPTRVAETAISGIVLARGVDPDSLPSSDAPPPAADQDLLLDEDSALLNRLGLAALRTLRPPSGQPAETAAVTLQSESGNDADTVLGCMRILLRVERHYDSAVWQTLLTVARGDALGAFLEALTAEQDGGASTGEAVATIGSAFGLTAGLVTAWQDLVPADA
jgi:hypothetical protein